MASVQNERLFACPMCGLALVADDREFRCESLHHFDVAKEGYVNLLLAQHRQSKDPGYSKVMIASRRDFFDAGHYEPLANQLGELVAQYLSDAAGRDDKVVLDAGCGEGYYLRAIRRGFESTKANTPTLCGIDVSKHGVQIAAKRDQLGRYAVASTHAMPILDGVVDLVLTHFSPVFAASFQRVLAPHGVVLVGGPGPRHLAGLKEFIYDEVQEHGPSDPLGSDSRFERIGTHKIQYGIELRNSTDVANLLAMTPFYWSASEVVQGRLAKLETLDTPVDVVVHAYRRR